MLITMLAESESALFPRNIQVPRGTRVIPAQAGSMLLSQLPQSATKVTP
jgi:hypothetical protein